MIFEDVCSLRNIILYVTNFYLIIDKLSGEFLELEKKGEYSKTQILAISGLWSKC